MRFGYTWTDPVGQQIAWLCGVLLVSVVWMLWRAATQTQHAWRRFGDLSLVSKLVSHDARVRRRWKGVLLVCGLVCACVALARPQYGKGVRFLPATTLDVVLVLDYSKSMYARDVEPSRIERAKSDIRRLMYKLPGARFGGVAFAGEAMSFPMTRDSMALGQFFTQLHPNDMPVGGTAIAKALVRARELLVSETQSKDHARVIALVTDGEDLEGRPMSVAQELVKDRIRIDVVQIGGRMPEVIPEMDSQGNVQGIRRNAQGGPLTTSLSSEGEAVLARMASVTGGRLIRSEHGQTGIDMLARELAERMRIELAEKVETLFAEVYRWPLGLCLALLFLEIWVGEAPRKGAAWWGRALPFWMVCLLLLLGGCKGWDARHPFERESPAVRASLEALAQGEAGVAVERLEGYLGTGSCLEGKWENLPHLPERIDSTFDLGLALFQLGEAYGPRFGEEGSTVPTGGGGGDRLTQIRCARTLLEQLRTHLEGNPALQARAHYLAGNLSFLVEEYTEAVESYDQALRLVPGEVDGGDSLGRDAAWNRALALRRQKEKEKPDAGADASPPDAGVDAGQKSDAGKEKENPGQGEGKDRDAGVSPPPPSPGAASPSAQGDASAAEVPPPLEDAREETLSDGGTSGGNAYNNLLDMLDHIPFLWMHHSKPRPPAGEDK